MAGDETGSQLPGNPPPRERNQSGVMPGWGRVPLSRASALRARALLDSGVESEEPSERPGRRPMCACPSVVPPLLPTAGTTAAIGCMGTGPGPGGTSGAPRLPGADHAESAWKAAPASADAECSSIFGVDDTGPVGDVTAKSRGGADTSSSAPASSSSPPCDESGVFRSSGGGADVPGRRDRRGRSRASRLRSIAPGSDSWPPSPARTSSAARRTGVRTRSALCTVSRTAPATGASTPQDSPRPCAAGSSEVGPSGMDRVESSDTDRSVSGAAEPRPEETSVTAFPSPSPTGGSLSGAARFSSEDTGEAQSGASEGSLSAAAATPVQSNHAIEVPATVVPVKTRARFSTRRTRVPSEH